jgi:hypothetical protein
MRYVVDTSSLLVLNNFYQKTFATLWSHLDDMAADGTLVSVREVLNELDNYNDRDFIQQWAKQHRAIFAVPSNEETRIVQRILAVPHFQTLISTQAILKGKPVADPFIIAAAMASGGTVVTEEAFKPNAAKIPNVCTYFNVPCMNLETFMIGQGWTF